MELGPIEKKDLKPLLAMLSKASPDLGYVDLKVLEEQTFGDPGYDGSFLIKATEKGTLAGAVLGVARTEAGGGRTGYVKYFGVAPKFRRKGAGRALFSELERRYLKREVREVRVGACPAPYLLCGVNVLETGAVSLLMRRGYQRTDTLIDMKAKLGPWKPDVLPGDKELAKEFKVRKAGAADQEALLAMLNKAFPFWIPEMQRGMKKGVVFVASNAEGVVAFACGNATLPGFFGPMGTLESVRGKGLGRLLLNRTLEAMKKAGVRVAQIPWAGPLPFYAKHARAEMGPVAWQFTKRL